MGKCTSAVSLPNQIEFWCRACVFLRSKKRGISSLCNWRLDGGMGAGRPGDYGKMSLSWTFSSFISYFAIFFFYYITQFSLSVFPETGKTSVHKGPGLFVFINGWGWKMPHCILFLHRNLHCSVCWGTIIDQQQMRLVGASCLRLRVNMHCREWGYHVDHWLMRSVKLSVCLIKVILWECP